MSVLNHVCIKNTQNQKQYSQKQYRLIKREVKNLKDIIKLKTKHEQNEEVKNDEEKSHYFFA